MNTLALIIAVLSTLFAGIGVLLLWRQIRKDHDWNQRNASAELLVSWVTGDVREIWKTLEIDFGLKLLGVDQNYKTVFDSLDDEDERQRLKSTVISLLNYLEVTSISIKSEVLDESIIYDFAALHFVLFRTWAQPLIDEYTKRDPTIFIEFRTYADKWQTMTEQDAATERLRQKRLSTQHHTVADSQGGASVTD